MILKNEFELVDENLLFCNNCNIPLTQNQKFLFSQICNHRLCENCYTKIFINKAVVSEICKLCQKSHEIKDYKDKHREEIYYTSDSINRGKIINV
jgi:hypothetical protein